MHCFSRNALSIYLMPCIQELDVGGNRRLERDELAEAAEALDSW